MKIFFLVILLVGIHLPVFAVFPAVIPSEKPDFPMSIAMERLYDEWNPHEDRANELYSNFKYSAIQGLEFKPNISR